MAAGRLAEGAEIFLLGLAKKLVLADGLARFADPGFAAAARHDPITFIEAWVALLAYGAADLFRFFGLFRHGGRPRPVVRHLFPAAISTDPIRRRSVGDFWRRWNITLSGFLRDYLYIPLGGNRRGEGGGWPIS